MNYDYATNNNASEVVINNDRLHQASSRDGFDGSMLSNSKVG